MSDARAIATSLSNYLADVEFRVERPEEPRGLHIGAGSGPPPNLVLPRPLALTSRSLSPFSDSGGCDDGVDDMFGDF